MDPKAKCNKIKIPKHIRQGGKADNKDRYIFISNIEGGFIQNGSQSKMERDQNSRAIYAYVPWRGQNENHTVE